MGYHDVSCGDTHDAGIEYRDVETDEGVVGFPRHTVGGASSSSSVSTSYNSMGHVNSMKGQTNARSVVNVESQPPTGESVLGCSQPHGPRRSPPTKPPPTPTDSQSGMDELRRGRIDKGTRVEDCRADHAAQNVKGRIVLTKFQQPRRVQDRRKNPVSRAERYRQWIDDANDNKAQARRCMLELIILQLQNKCRERRLHVSGSKTELIDRLLTNISHR
eukprot:TRINITY_DN29609_c0_g2_i1.p1 TRINITY_DN29609_c0_g2~~TRINITY_DN29609_c0_g2_i1.p1  ORF type:complete len:229 (+),score=9.36 TRINITY_DN29609_c0_g2_i1:35-688(+)